MSTIAQFADISAWQGAVDWNAYARWASSFDGIVRISLRSSYGRGYTDAHYAGYRAGVQEAALAAKATLSIIHYHYAYPNLNKATDEADWQHSVVGRVGPYDLLMLDYEENVPQATAQWANAWLSRQEQNYGGRLPTIYASDAFIRARLQDNRLARFPLTLANWQFTPSERPACPPPWSHYTYLQYSDRATIPGIPGSIDANMYLGPHSIPQEETMIPLTINDVKSYFTENADKSWTRLSAQTGVPLLDSAGKPIVLKGAILSDWCAHGTDALPDIGLPEGNETQVDAKNHPEIVEQQFERCTRRYDPHHAMDSPLHAGVVYSTHIEGLYSAQTKLEITLEQLATVEKQLAAAQQASPESPYVAAVKAVKGIVDPLTV